MGQTISQSLQQSTRQVAEVVHVTVRQMWTDLQNPTIESNNRLAIFLLGFLPGAFGSLTTFCMAAWSVWAVFSIVRGTYQPRLSTTAWLVALALSALPAALAVGMIGGDKNLELLRKAPEAAVFLCGWFLLFRFESRPRHEQFDLLTMGGALGCIAALMVACVQFSLGYRAEGGAGNANVFCLVMSVQTLFALSGLLQQKKAFRLLSAIGATSGAMCVVLSGSRLGWIFFLIAVAAAFFSMAHNRNFSRHAITRGAFALVLFMAAVLLTNWQRLVAAQQDIRMIAILGDYNSSIGERVIYWISGFRAFMEAPFAGHGINNRMAAVAANAPDGYASFITATHPHNDYLASAVDSGIFGLVGLLIALCGPYFLLRYVLRSNHAAVSLAGCVTLTFALFGLNGNMFGHDLSSAVFLLTITHLTAICTYKS
jgi:O-antigen ligase